MLHAAVYNQSLNILTPLGVNTFQGFTVTKYEGPQIDKCIRPRVTNRKVEL